MKVFVLVDPSLKMAGGHELEYAKHVLQAARKAGYEVSLATHRGFPEALSRDMGWPVLPLLRDSFSRERSFWARGTEAPRSNGEGLLRRAHEWLHHRRQRELVEGLQRLFRLLPLEPESLVFFPLMSGPDLAALLRFLDNHPWTGEVSWCVQFQYPPPRSEVIRRSFSSLATGARRHRVRCFATTEPIAREYRRLGLEATAVLPYPADPAIRPRPTNPVAEPLDLVMAGYLRSEKGPHRVREVLEALWRDYLETGRLRVWLQGRRAQLRRLLAPAMRPLLRTADPANGSDAGPLCCVGHPLSTRVYRDYLMNAQIGLILYDQKIYHQRCSGVLVELLAAGVPVVVPAETWMADQLAEPTLRHRAGNLQNPGTPPRGAVGLSAKDTRQFVDAVADIVQHYPHYRATALKFAQGWRSLHGPQSVLRALEQAAAGSAGEEGLQFQQSSGGETGIDDAGGGAAAG